MIVRKTLLNVPHALMAVETAIVFFSAVNDARYGHGMAAHAVVLDNLPSGVLDPDDLRIPEGKHVRMPHAMLGLGGILADQSVRYMAIVAGREAVRRNFPRLVIIVHHVAVDARFGIIQHIRVALGIDERVAAHAHKHTKNHRNRDGECRFRLHQPAFFTGAAAAA